MQVFAKNSKNLQEFRSRILTAKKQIFGFYSNSPSSCMVEILDLTDKDTRLKTLKLLKAAIKREQSQTCLNFAE